MPEQPEPVFRQMTIHVRPFDAPEAQDYYMNLTGVVNTQHEVILMFARALPPTDIPKGDELSVAPALRVAIPAAAARHLLGQLKQMLELRERVEKQADEHDPEK